MSEVKNFTPMDLALLRRLTSRSLRLDIAETIENAHPLETAMLGAVGVKNLGRPTYILRHGEASYAAQMRLDDTHGRITFIAPEPEPDCQVNPWLAILETIVHQAGRRGGHVVTAEVPIDGRGFELFRLANFVVYSRERLYRLNGARPPALALPNEQLIIRSVEDIDHFRLSTLYTSTVPQLIQHVLPMPQHWNGYAVILNGRLRGYLETQIGKSSILLQPYLHPELYDLAVPLLRQVLHLLPERPVFIRLRAYQEWLRHALEIDLGFSEQAQYALMAHHTVVRKTAPAFSPLAVLEHITLAPSPEIALEISSRKEKS